MTLVNPIRFVRDVSESPRLKFLLAWSSFACLVFPSAVLMAVGVGPKYVLSGMGLAIIPFQYLVFCIIDSRQGSTTTDAGGPSLSESSDLGFLMPQFVPLPAPARWSIRFEVGRIRLYTNGGRQGHPEVRSTDGESLSDDGPRAQLRPSAQICYTKA